MKTDLNLLDLEFRRTSGSPVWVSTGLRNWHHRKSSADFFSSKLNSIDVRLKSKVMLELEKGVKLEHVTVLTEASSAKRCGSRLTVPRDKND